MTNNNSELTQSNKEKLDKILSFPFVGGRPLEKPDTAKSKTVTTAIVQGGIRKITTSLKPIKQRSEIDKLEAILTFAQGP